MQYNVQSKANSVATAAVVEKAFLSERKRVFDFIRRRVRTEEDAEDILQDVFYQLASGYSVTQPIENLAAWLFTVARNKITDMYRKKKPELLPGDYDSPDVSLNLADILPDDSQNPDAVQWRALVWEELEDALDELPAEQRQAFVMHELEGKSFKEMAETTGEPINTLLSRKRYAVLFLRERLQELYSEFLNN